MGGGDDNGNIVRLTGREHYVVHQLLVKIYPGVPGLATAAVRMAKQCVGNRAYEWLRILHGIATSSRQRGKSCNTGRVRPQHERDKISKSLKGIPKTPQTKERMSLAQMGNRKTRGLVRGPMSDAHKAKVSAALRGRASKPRGMQEIVEN
jgi:NUMOD3 motif